MIVLLSVVAVLLASPIFGQGRNNVQSDQGAKAPPPPPSFVEASAPDGKALIYIYNSRAQAFLQLAMTPLILTKNGPVGPLPQASYYSYVTDPGTIRFWLVGFQTIEVKVEAVAGHVYYIKGRLGKNMNSVPTDILFELAERETAMKEISDCKQLTE
jgi:hypothetical protein